MKKRSIKTQEEARQYAIDWQQWASDKNLSYSELVVWQAIFEDLAIEFDLTEEFNENGLTDIKLCDICHKPEDDDGRCGCTNQNDC